MLRVHSLDAIFGSILLIKGARNEQRRLGNRYDRVHRDPVRDSVVECALSMHVFDGSTAGSPHVGARTIQGWTDRRIRRLSSCAAVSASRHPHLDQVHGEDRDFSHRSAFSQNVLGETYSCGYYFCARHVLRFFHPSWMVFLYLMEASSDIIPEKSYARIPRLH